MDNNQNNHYKLGVFYYNKDNPSPFVKRRYGFGITMNWASPFAWLITILIIAAIVYFTI